MKPAGASLGIEPSDLGGSDRLVRKVLRAVQKRFGVERAAIYLFNPNLGDLEMDSSVGVGVEWRSKRVGLGKGVVGWVASRGEAARADLRKTSGDWVEGGARWRHR